MLTPTRPNPHAVAEPVPGAHLRTLGLTKTYGTTRALDHVDIAIPAGQSVAVMGPSGSGKTTLLHCLSGILSADSGSIELGLPDRVVNVESLSSEGRAQLRRQSLGFVFQQGMLVPELTAVENTALPLMLNGASRSQAVGYAVQWLSSMGLGGMEERRIGQLSGGQAQRVAIARSQVIDPAIVFADEPPGAPCSRRRPGGDAPSSSSPMTRASPAAVSASCACRTAGSSPTRCAIPTGGGDHDHEVHH